MIARARPVVPLLACLLAPIAARTAEPDRPPVSERARRVHEAALLFDGHNDLPWRLRVDGDVAFKTLDIGKRLDSGQTDIPRAREGGLDAQFWSVYIPSDHPDPARTVAQQVDLVHRMVERYPDDLELATTAADVDRIVKAGKIASLIGIEGGVAIEDDLALLRDFARLGVRYMTLTHNASLAWADAATGEARSDGLSPFGERVVREMNRLGMLVDISHVAPSTMADALRVSRAPVIASHSSAFALCPSPRNVPDDILAMVKQNGGVVMVNFYSGFLVPDFNRRLAAAREELHARHPAADDDRRAFEAFMADNVSMRGDVALVADHIDHIVKVAGIDHVGIGSDFDGITAWPVGLDDVADFPRLTEELLRRGYPEDDIRKILGGNVLRAFREAGEVAQRLQKTTEPEVDRPASKGD